MERAGHAYFCYPFTLDVYLGMVFFNRVYVRPLEQAKAHSGVLVVEKVHVPYPKFVRWERAEFLQVFFTKRDLVNIKKYWHVSQSIHENIRFP